MLKRLHLAAILSLACILSIQTSEAELITEEHEAWVEGEYYLGPEVTGSWIEPDPPIPGFPYWEFTTYETSLTYEFVSLGMIEFTYDPQLHMVVYDVQRLEDLIAILASEITSYDWFDGAWFYGGTDYTFVDRLTWEETWAPTLVPIPEPAGLLAMLAGALVTLRQRRRL